MVGYSLFFMRYPCLIPGQGSIFLEICSIAIFFFCLQGLDFIEPSFACIQSFWCCNFLNRLLDRKFSVSTCYCISVIKMLRLFCRGMHVGKNMRNIPTGANQGKTTMSKRALVKKFTNLNSFLIIKQGNINRRIMSSIFINKTKNINFSSNKNISKRSRWIELHLKLMFFASFWQHLMPWLVFV